VTKYPLVIVRDMKKVTGPFDDKNPEPKINVRYYYYAYRFIRMIYTCIYFYFMPFVVLSVPLINLIYSNNNEMISDPPEAESTN